MSVMSLVRSMNEGGWWEINFAEKKTRLLCTLKQQDDYSGTAPLPLRSMPSRFRMPHDVRSCVESCCMPDACTVKCSRKRVLVLTCVHYANTRYSYFSCDLFLNQTCQKSL